jgi:uncharacterized protein (TIGR02646 family)
MIRLAKRDEPQVLREHAASWEKVLRDHEANGTKPTKADLERYNNIETKAALLVETAEKCAYCESKFRHITPGDIEHIVPKRLGPEWRFKWENLTLACTTCNTKKGAKEDLVDPYIDDPEQLFHSCGPAMLPDPSSGKALATEAALELNRSALVDRRTERLRNLHRMLIIAQQQTDASHREILLNELRLKETRSDAEFAAMSRAYVSDLVARGIITAA